MSDNRIINDDDLTAINLEPVDNTNILKTLSSDKFWLKDPAVLFRSNNYYKIIPTQKMTTNEKLNALTRFFILLAILLLIFCSCTEYLYIPIIGIVTIIIVYFILRKKSQNNVEKFDNQNEDDEDNYETPTTENPYMNVTLADLMENPDRSAASTIGNNIIAKNIDAVLGNSKRQFYTMPSTTIPNDQTTFIKWVYDTPPTCKEDQGACLRYEDIRFNRYNPDIENPNKN